jgi:8-oxo-dGTP pyrophosphatase MutT (NUDIX family)
MRPKAPRESVSAVALIRREEEGRCLFLAQWNTHWQAFHFVSGHRLAEESFRECAVREVSEELGLSAGDDFIVADQPLAHLEYGAWSESARTETFYIVEVFPVELRPSALGPVADNPQNRWVTAAEIAAGLTADGRRVSPTMALILSKLP